MKNLKKALVLLLTAMLTMGFAVSITACRNGDDKASSSKKDSSKPPFTFSVTDDWGEEGDWTDNY